MSAVKITRERTVPDELLDRLLAAGLLTGPAQRADALSGPLLSRWSISDASGRHVWLDAPGSGGAAPAPIPPPGPQLGGDVVTPRPTTVPGAGVAYVVPWAPRLLADAVGRATSAPSSDPETQLDVMPIDATQLVEVAAALGRALRRLHALPVEIGAAAEPPLLVRLRTDLPAASLAARRCWAEVAAEVRAAPGVTLVHGEPATGHVLVPSHRHEHPDGRDIQAGGPRAALLGWGPPAVASPALDVGYLIGDLLELSVVGGQGDAMRAALCQAAQAVRAGYVDDAGLLPAAFWRQAALAASLKIVDHELRLWRSGLHDGTPAVGAMLGAIATDLLDPRGQLGRLLSEGGAP